MFDPRSTDESWVANPQQFMRGKVRDYLSNSAATRLERVGMPMISQLFGLFLISDRDVEEFAEKLRSYGVDLDEAFEMGDRFESYAWRNL